MTSLNVPYNTSSPLTIERGRVVAHGTVVHRHILPVVVKNVKTNLKS